MNCSYLIRMISVETNMSFWASAIGKWKKNTRCKFINFSPWQDNRRTWRVIFLLLIQEEKLLEKERREEKGRDSKTKTKILRQKQKTKVRPRRHRHLVTLEVRPLSCIEKSNPSCVDRTQITSFYKLPSGVGCSRRECASVMTLFCPTIPLLRLILSEIRDLLSSFLSYRFGFRATSISFRPFSPSEIKNRNDCLLFSDLFNSSVPQRFCNRWV